MIILQGGIMPELVDIVDTDTGEILKEDMLAASAYIWAAEKGWEVVGDEIDTLDLVYENGEELGPKTVRWIYIKDPRHDAEVEKQKRSRIFWQGGIDVEINV
jgi:hypothetical protein